VKVANHFWGDITFQEARALLEASPYWAVEDGPEGSGCSDGWPSILVRLLPQEDGDPKPQHGLAQLYHQDNPLQRVKVSHYPTRTVMICLELTLQTRFIDMCGYGSYWPWWDMEHLSEQDYERHLREFGEWLGLHPDLPPWKPESLAYLDELQESAHDPVGNPREEVNEAP
jgi:hypothetical protein